MFIYIVVCCFRGVHALCFFGHFIRFACAAKYRTQSSQGIISMLCVCVCVLFILFYCWVGIAPEDFTRSPNEFIIKFPYSDNWYSGDFSLSRFNEIEQQQQRWRQRRQCVDRRNAYAKCLRVRLAVILIFFFISAVQCAACCQGT